MHSNKDINIFPKAYFPTNLYPIIIFFSVKRLHCTAQKMKFSIKDFFSNCDQICRKLRIWSHLLKKSLMENFIFCAVLDTRCKLDVRKIFLETSNLNPSSMGRTSHSKNKSYNYLKSGKNRL